MSAAVVDGDTRGDDRDRARDSARIMLSNPDTIHASLLSDHRRWARFLANVRFVVLDEAHVYRGERDVNDRISLFVCLCLAR